MAADNQNEDQELSAPASLVEALRRLDRRRLLVTPQLDESILSRPRLHLARIRELRKGGQFDADEDLALAARTSAQEPLRGPEFGRAQIESTPRRRWWRPLSLGTAIAFALLAVIVAVTPTRGMHGLFSLGSLPAPVVLIAVSLVFAAVWIASRRR